MGDECRGGSGNLPKGRQTAGQAHLLSSPFSLQWSVVVMIGAPAAILYYKVTLLKVVE